VRAGLLNSEDEFYISDDEVFKWIEWITKLGERLTKIQYDSSESILYCLWEESKSLFSVIEIFDWKERSQHVAFLDYNWNFYDQDGPDWPIRLWENIDYLLDEYKEKLWWTAYYQIHILNKDLSMNVESFLNDLK
jgi:hypothetical protein